MHFIFAKNIKDMSHSSSPKTPEAIPPPKPAAVSPDAQMSSVQSTGPCVYKEKCVCPGKTLFACVQCESRFHHLCASSVGGSDDMNMCRANCDGTPPQKTTATKDTSPQKTTATKNPPPVNPKAPTKKLTQKAEFFVAKPAGEDVTTIPGDSDEDDLLLKNANQQEMAHKKKSNSRRGDPGRDREGHQEKDRDSKSKQDGTRRNDKCTEVQRERLRELAKEKQRDSRGKWIGSGREGGKHRDKANEPQGGRMNASSSPVRRRGKDDIMSDGSSNDSDHHSNNPQPSPPKRPTEGGKLPKKVPRPQHRPENKVPSKLAGGRPTIDPALPNHREMILPLFVDEPVIYADPDTNEPLLGTVAKTVENERDKVTVLPLDDNMDEIRDLTIPDFKVIKATDYLIYCGIRYAVFGPPPHSFCGLGWGHAWLDLVNERAHFHEESQAHDKLLYELKRLDCVMLKYPGIPDCPVLVLGFLQNRTDDSNWTAIGLLNCTVDDVLDNAVSANRHICGMTMQNLKADFDSTATYIVESACELYQHVHPMVILYKKAMRWIETWSRNNPAWTPQKTWKSKLTQLYAKEFKAATSRAIQGKPCPSCVSLLKKQDKTEV